MRQREKLDPYWHKARIAARLYMKAIRGNALTERERRVARWLSEERGVSNRLIQQGILAALGGPYRVYATKSGPKEALYVIDDLEELANALGQSN
jgi:hypothetical protein